MDFVIRGLRSDEIKPMCALVERAYAEKQLGLGMAQVMRTVQADPAFDPELNRVVALGDRLVGRLYIHDRTMSCGNHDLRVGAIGGVCTDPDYRGRGLCRRLLADATDFMRDRGFDVSLLFGEPAVYGPSGWMELVTFGMTVNLPLSKVDGVHVRPADLSRDGDVLRGLHRRFNAGLTGPFVRSSDYWDRWFAFKLDAKAWRVWLVDYGAEPVGYFIDHAGTTGTRQIRELAWRRDDAHALPALLAGIAGQPALAADFSFYLPELRDALLYESRSLTVAELRAREYALNIRANYSGLFKLICAGKLTAHGVRDTEDMLRFFRRNDYVFWACDAF